jgi:hypothetical protein
MLLMGVILSGLQEGHSTATKVAQRDMVEDKRIGGIELLCLW